MRYTWKSAVVFALFVCVQDVLADTVFLRDGRTLEGTVVEQRADEIVFRMGSTQITLPRTNIEKIEISSPSQTPESEPTPHSSEPDIRPEKSSGILKPAQFEALFNKIPEIKDGQTSENVIGTYRELVAGLPSDAARWILEMGQFIEDRKITDYEKRLLEQLKDVKDALVYLTSPRIMDGVSGWDVDWARGWSPKKGEYLYLDKDLRELEKAGLLPGDIRPALKDFVAKAEGDFEMRKGLCLIFNYGHPATNVSQLDINTQLLMLCHLLHYGIAQGEERLALAAALCYGSALSISEKSLWPRIIEFVRHRLDYISETTSLLKKQGADWDPRDYPLQGCIGLLWGANSQAWVKGLTGNLAVRFRRNSMKPDEFESLFVSGSTMIEMRDWLIESGIFSRRKGLEEFAQRNPELGNNYNSKISAAAELGIRRSWQLDLWHPDFPTWDVNWQWRYYKNSGSFCGHCRSSGAVGCFLMRSMNIGVLQRSHAYWHYIPAHDVWRFGSDELTQIFNRQFQKEVTWYPDLNVYHKVPWDNFHLGFERGPLGGTDGNIIVFHATRNATLIPDGIPGGYVFRKSTPCWWTEKAYD